MFYDEFNGCNIIYIGNYSKIKNIYKKKLQNYVLAKVYVKNFKWFKLQRIFLKCIISIKILAVDYLKYVIQIKQEF